MLAYSPTVGRRGKTDNTTADKAHHRKDQFQKKKLSSHPQNKISKLTR